MADKPFVTQRYIRKTGSVEKTTKVNENEQDNYFEYVSILYYIVVITGYVLFEVFCFQTSLFPFERLGEPGERLRFLATNHMAPIRLGFLFTILLHVFEAAYAHSQCRSVNLSESATYRWTIQTFIVGYASLKILNEYCEKKSAEGKRLQ